MIWTGPALAPWLAEPLETLSGGEMLALLETEGWPRLAVEDAEEHDAHEEHDDHDHDEHAHQEHDHDHNEHAHDDHEDHEHEDHDDHGHAHGGEDPHAWLDPVVAAVWVGHIADALAAADPENAATYRANADAARDALDALTAEAAEALAPVATAPFAVSHDGYGYFVARFGLTKSAAITLTDGQRPGPATIRALREQLAGDGTRCILVDPAEGDDFARLVTEGTDIVLTEADPLGAALSIGPELYPALVAHLAGALGDCLAPR